MNETYVGIYDPSLLRLAGVFRVSPGGTDLPGLLAAIANSYQGMQIEPHPSGLITNAQTGAPLCIGREAFVETLKAQSRQNPEAKVDIDTVMAVLDEEFRARTGGHNDQLRQRLAYAEQAVAQVKAQVPAAPDPEHEMKRQFDLLMAKIRERPVEMTIYLTGWGNEIDEVLDCRSDEVVYIDELGRPPYAFMYPDHVKHLISEKRVCRVQLHGPVVDPEKAVTNGP